MHPFDMRRLLGMVNVASTLSLRYPQVSVPGERSHRAFVVGIGDYISFGQLSKSVSDATDMATLLDAKGFCVSSALNPTRARFVEDFDEFCKDLGGARSVVVHYAGHGLAPLSESFLVAVDSTTGTSDVIRLDAMSLYSNSGAVPFVGIVQMHRRPGFVSTGCCSGCILRHLVLPSPCFWIVAGKCTAPLRMTRQSFLVTGSGLRRAALLHTTLHLVHRATLTRMVVILRFCSQPRLRPGFRIRGGRFFQGALNSSQQCLHCRAAVPA